MRRQNLLALALAAAHAFVACDDSPTYCPTSPPASPARDDDVGISFSPPTTIPSEGPPTPLVCGYIDSCGDFECSTDGNGWSCVRIDDAGCADASNDSDSG
jgi:hypothetical protein